MIGYYVNGPDGIGIHPEPFKLKDIPAAIATWISGYERQGYYRDARGQRIELKDLLSHLTIEPDPKVLETLTDIAFLAGGMRYHSGDSRADVQQFIAWAEEFEEMFRRHVEGDPDKEFDYMEMVEAFAQDKFINSGHVPLKGDS